MTESRETFTALLHSKHAAMGKLIVLELARVRGEPVNITQLADRLYSRIGEIDSSLHSLERAELIERGPERTNRDMIRLHPNSRDLIEMLGDLVDDEE